MSRIRIAARPRARVRCVYCHAPFGERARPARCSRCGILLHRVCALYLRACPTLGCSKANAARGARLPDPRLVRRAAVLAASLAIFFVPLVASRLPARGEPVAVESKPVSEPLPQTASSGREAY